MNTGYISGPMRSMPDNNFPAFDEATKLGRRMGYVILNPAEMDRLDGVSEYTDAVCITPEMIRRFVARDVAALLSLRSESGDFIAMLPGWDKSYGARAELAIAEWLQLKVLDATDFMPLKDKGAIVMYTRRAKEVYGNYLAESFADEDTLVDFANGVNHE